MREVKHRGVKKRISSSLSLEEFIGGDCSLGCCDVVRPFRESLDTWSPSVGLNSGWKTDRKSTRILIIKCRKSKENGENAQTFYSGSAKTVPTSTLYIISLFWITNTMLFLFEEEKEGGYLLFLLGETERGEL